MISETCFSFQQAELAADLAVALVDYTSSIQLCGKIPFVLSRALGIEKITLAIIHSAAGDADSQFILCSGSGRLDIPLIQEKIRAIIVQLSPLLANDPKVPCQSFQSRNLDDHFVEQGATLPGLIMRVNLFTRMIDTSHRMCLMVQADSYGMRIEIDMIENLHIVAQELSKELRVTLAYHDSFPALGAPFDLLTTPEVKVLAGLDSDLSEKQLAAQLGLAPNTLHSHIKSIYRKIGVQGRLPLLLRLRSVIRRIRLDAHKALEKAP